MVDWGRWIGGGGLGEVHWGRWIGGGGLWEGFKVIKICCQTNTVIYLIKAGHVYEIKKINNIVRSFQNLNC